MARSERRKIGDLGEDIAAKYLKKRGFTIIDRNYLKPWGELDIVAKRRDKLHFVEVKSVSRESGKEGEHIRPEENMHEKKVIRLHRAIQTYLSEKRLVNSEWQIDLACVYLDILAKRARVELFLNIIL